MKSGAGKQVLVLLAAFLLVAVSQFSFAPSASWASLYDWSSTTPLMDTDPPGVPGESGRNITQAFWAYDASYYYFRMDLADSPANSSSFGFYFDTGPAGDSFSGGGGGATLSGIDVILRVENADLVAPYPSDFLFSDGHILEWKVASSYFSSGDFTWWAATTTNSYVLKDVTGAVGAVTTPIPNAAWLLGSGIIALLVLRRRKPTT